MKHFAVVLSGCGYQDGAEITESISTLIALGQNGASYEIFAPNIDVPSVNHLNGTATGEKRNLLQEGARIARGHIQPLSNLNEKNFDGLIFPGGYGAAKSLSSWATAGSKATVLSDVEKNILAFYNSGKPIAAICIAPTLVAKVLGSKHITVTIGTDLETAAEVQKTGALHENCKVTDFISDRDHKIITTPAYMFDSAKPSEVFQGISRAIKECVEMA